MLYQYVLHTQEFMQQSTGETLSTAVLDSRAASTVCGKTWKDEETLSDEDRLEVTKEPSSMNFHLLKKLPYQQQLANSLSELELML